MKKTILTAQDHEFLNQIDEYTLYDYLSNYIVMFGGMKPEEVEDREIGITEYQVKKYLDNINTSALEDSELRHAENMFLKGLFEELETEEE